MFGQPSQGLADKCKSVKDHGKMCWEIDPLWCGDKCCHIPNSNEKDFEALPAEIKENVTVHFVKTFEDVYKIAFESDL